MKTRVFLLSLILVISGTMTTIVAQDTVLTKKEEKQIAKEQKKKEKATQAEQQQARLVKMLSKRFFVFQATRLYGPQGRSFSVSPSINFLSVIDSLVTFQFGFEQLSGWNGVGGVTLEGYTDDYVFNRNDSTRRPMTVDSKVRPATGIGRPYFTITVQNNGQADLDLILGGPDRIRMSGRIVDPVESGIYKGQTIW